MRIAFLTLNYSPEMGATATRLDALATGLAARGHEVRVVTAMPNYPSGKITDGYRRRLRLQEEDRGVLVMRSTIYPSRSARAFPRFFGQFSFALSCLLQMRGLGRQDVILIESPPLVLVPSGLALGRMSRAKVIMNVSDIWPDLPLRVGYRMSRLSLELLRLLERGGYRFSDAVTTTTPGAAETISERFPDVQTAVISNGVDIDQFRPERRSEAVRSSLGAGPDDFLIGYCGLHGLFQGLELVIDAAVRLRDDPRFRFVLVGDGPAKKEIMHLADGHRLSNIRFEDAVPLAEVPAILASCDAGLVPLATELPHTVPSKIYEVLASGIPPVVTAGCEGADLVERVEAGRTFPHGDPEALAAVLKDLQSSDRSQLSQACREAAQCFDRKTIVLEAERIIAAVAAGQPLPQRDAWEGG